MIIIKLCNKILNFKIDLCGIDSRWDLEIGDKNLC